MQLKRQILKSSFKQGSLDNVSLECCLLEMLRHLFINQINLTYLVNTKFPNG